MRTVHEGEGSPKSGTCVDSKQNSPDYRTERKHVENNEDNMHVDSGAERCNFLVIQQSP